MGSGVVNQEVTHLPLFQLKQRRTNIMTVGIIGHMGHVGKAQHALFSHAYVYDVALERQAERYVVESRNPNFSKEKTYNSDVVFVCVPTNPLPNGSLDMSIIEDVVSKCGDGVIAVRSTLNPGTADYLSIKYKKKLVVIPEYTGMSGHHPNTNMAERSFLILGGELEDVNKVISLYTTAHNANTKIRRVTARQAEIIKLTENRAIGYKVMQMHELYLACKASGEDYYTIRDAVYSDDWRFNLWFTFIYGGDNEQLGFESSHCLSKDLPAWCAWVESLGVDSSITRKLVSKSREWKGRNSAEILEEHKVRNYRLENGVHS
jgi:UDP-glucose 6-dehydrogenase